MKYTKHQLTDPMLRRLSQVINRRVTHHGVAMAALIRRGLVSETTRVEFRLLCPAHGVVIHGEETRRCPRCHLPIASSRRTEYREGYEATCAGIDALAAARTEGW